MMGNRIDPLFRSLHAHRSLRRSARVSFPTAFLLLLGVIIAASIFVGACGQGDLPLEAVDPKAAPEKPTYDQVRIILDRSCLPCHGQNAAKSLEDGEDEESPDYSTCAGIHAGLEGIGRTILERGSMPPGAWPRLSEEEKLLVQRWLDQGACSPCSSPCP